jgi:hypothetical protein
MFQQAHQQQSVSHNQTFTPTFSMEAISTSDANNSDNLMDRTDLSNSAHQQPYHMHSSPYYQTAIATNSSNLTLASQLQTMNRSTTPEHHSYHHSQILSSAVDTYRHGTEEVEQQQQQQEQQQQQHDLSQHSPLLYYHHAQHHPQEESYIGEYRYSIPSNHQELHPAVPYATGMHSENHYEYMEPSFDTDVHSQQQRQQQQQQQQQMLSSLNIHSNNSNHDNGNKSIINKDKRWKKKDIEK